ncbi:LVIVD repeat-containing protein [Sedimentitalea nanhaiensis]|uniref:Uncharacterized conserved protein n=1 Tax=Sedimentitalea nanhaiensis TaxID=999627 RepID=A0A1I7E6C0_9RHOB|nr:hypothetical protein [Sedimentitalea nanhaiensis]SFU19480.1 Uncharacterized conserved protein [Sedimentitalea nanhaiensis]
MDGTRGTEMGLSRNTKLLSHVDCPGGGQVWVEGTTLYIGHMRNPSGTTIVDVADPRDPKVIARIDVPDGWHSHKVRVSSDGLMVVNHEKLGPDGDWEFGGGMAVYDVTKPADPRMIGKWTTGGRGVHRYDFDGRYAYISPTVEGYVGNIVMILDLIDPTNPVEVGRWWVPGQHLAGGEEGNWLHGVVPRCHHPIRRGNRLYVSYWHEGLFILDISDMANPKLISRFNTSGAFPHPTHTCLPMASPIKGRDIMVVADEDVAKLYPSAPAFTWIYDITDETVPTPISTWQVPGLDVDGRPQEPMTGCHQPSERVSGTIVPFAWFAQGLRLVDIADPFNPTEVGHFLPKAAPGAARPSSNDVTIDDRGIVYLIDRVNGVDIIETTVF